MAKPNAIWEGYLILKQRSKYRELNARLTKNSPQLYQGEVAIKLRGEFPQELFERPILQAKITVPREAVQKSIINAEVQDNVQRLIKEAIGVDIAFTITETKEQEENV